MLRWLTIAATAGMITVNGLANALPINGKTTGDISDGFNILFTPAGWVFSIWGLIYLGLIVFSIVQALPSLRDHADIRAIRPWYLLNTGANAAWIVAWHHELFGLSLGIMLVILGTLVVIQHKLTAVTPRDGLRYAAVRVPLTLYFAWITIATIANTTVVLSTLGAEAALADPGVTLGILTFAAIVGATISLKRNDPVVSAVYVWALVGIASKNATEPSLHAGALAFAGASALIGCIALFGLVRRRRQAVLG